MFKITAATEARWARLDAEIEEYRNRLDEVYAKLGKLKKNLTANACDIDELEIQAWKYNNTISYLCEDY